MNEKDLLDLDFELKTTILNRWPLKQKLQKKLNQNQNRKKTCFETPNGLIKMLGKSSL
jgi:hypothetical protein